MSVARVLRAVHAPSPHVLQSGSGAGRRAAASYMPVTAALDILPMGIIIPVLASLKDLGASIFRSQVCPDSSRYCGL